MYSIRVAGFIRQLALKECRCPLRPRVSLEKKSKEKSTLPSFCWHSIEIDGVLRRSETRDSAPCRSASSRATLVVTLLAVLGLVAALSLLADFRYEDDRSRFGPQRSYPTTRRRARSRATACA